MARQQVLARWSTPPADPPSHGTSAQPAAPRRRVGPHRALPTGRAVVGGLLVAGAMVGAVALSRTVGAPETVPVVVASAAISPFDPLGTENLEVMHLAMPDQVLESTYSDPADLAGTVSRSHLRPGEVLNQGDVVESTRSQREAAPAREISLRIDADRAVDGRLETGDRVDVLATYGNGVDALTFVVLADAPVLSVASVDSRIGSSGALVLTLALDHRSETVALAHAADNADLTVVRTTTAVPQAETGSTDELGPFRPVASDD